MSSWARDGAFLSTVLFIGHVTVPSAKLLLSIFLSERLRFRLNLTSGPRAQSWADEGGSDSDQCASISR